MAFNRIRKTKFVCILSLLMILTSIHSGQATAASINLPSTAIPLSSTTYKSNAVWSNDDISTSELIGVRRASALFEYSQRSKRRQLYLDSHIPFISSTGNCENFNYKTAVKQSLATGIDSKYKIIRYIHDQDGEKDNLFHY